MLLHELFNTVIDYDVIRDTPNRLVAEFSIGDNIYHVFVEKRDNSDEWVWLFCAVDDKRKPLGNCEFNATGTGNEFAVFSTAINVLKRAIETKNIQKLEFSADGLSRVRMYDRLSNRLPHMRLVHREENGLDDVIYYLERV